MNSQKILYSNGKNDELHTPVYGVTPILPFIKKDSVVWCPFDKSESNFVKEISKTNKVIFSHIEDGKDFYEYEPEEHWDCIISNPPFSRKRFIFERALSFKKPFALLANLATLNDRNPAFCFHDAGVQLQIMKFNKRIFFVKPDGTVDKKITFSSGYFCYDFLPNNLMLENLNTPD